jgi:hypothetical protein
VQAAMPLDLLRIVFHPVLVTLLALVVLVLLLRWTGWWARYKYRILLVLLADYAIDTAMALPRILFAHDLNFVAGGETHSSLQAERRNP